MNEAVLSPQNTLQKLTREKFVHFFRKLPDLVMRQRHGLYFDPCDGDEKFFINETRKQYRYTALWLEYYFLERTEYLFEAKLKPQFYYEPFAEIQMAYFNLIKKVYVYSKKAQDYYPSPVNWLYGVAVDECESELRNSGYLGQPTFLGKSAAYKEVREVCKKLEDPKNYHAKAAKATTKNTSHMDFLCLEALAISDIDAEFKNTNWQNFLRSKKNFQRKIVNSPFLPAFISSEKLIIKSNGVRGKDTRKRERKGFG